MLRFFWMNVINLQQSHCKIILHTIYAHELPRVYFILSMHTNNKYSTPE